MAEKQYEVIVVGGGASGLTAGMFTARRGYKTLIISQDVGGQAATTPDIENYPGMETVNGLDLMQKFKKQAEKFGADFSLDTVHAIKESNPGMYVVAAATQTVEAPVVILAFGLSHRHLNVPGEEKLSGKGLLYCSICEAHYYKGKNVVVVGGGSSAVQAATTLSHLAKTVTIVNVTEHLNAEAIIIQRMTEKENIKVVAQAEVKEVLGEDHVTGIRIQHNDTKQQEEVSTDVVFVEIGYMAKAEWVKGFVDTDARGQIKIGPNCETSKPGIFAAGDITTITFKQVIISAGEGAKAALEADQYLLAKTGKRGARIDWGAKKK
jgi:thioredoxin-disulfide reductase